ncbi:hypothetical protein Tco_0452685 [Tanacetum coccineum]
MFSEAQGVSLRITKSKYVLLRCKALPRRVWGLRVVDSYTGNCLEDSFTPLETIQRFQSTIGRRSHSSSIGRPSRRRGGYVIKANDPAHAVNTQPFEEESSSDEDLDEWLNAEMEKHISKQNEKNKEDALIAIIKSIREECRDVHKNKQIRVSEADLKKSFEAMEDTVDNDSFTSNSPYQPSLEELNPGSFLLPFTIDNSNSYAKAIIDASNNFMPRSIYQYLKLANLGGGHYVR